MRIHRFLQAKNAEPRNSGGCGPSPHTCKVAHELGSLSAPSASGFDANDHQATAFASQEFVVLALLFSTCTCEDNAVRGGFSNARQSMGCECTSDRNVHSQLRSLEQRKSAGKNFDGLLIGCWHCDVHATEFGVASDQCTRLTANAGQCSLRSDSPCAKPTRSCARCPMSLRCVQSAPALANSVGDIQWETEPLRHEIAEEMRFHLKLFLSWSSTDDVAGTRSGM